MDRTQIVYGPYPVRTRIRTGPTGGQGSGYGMDPDADGPESRYGLDLYPDTSLHKIRIPTDPNSLGWTGSGSYQHARIYPDPDQQLLGGGSCMKYIE